MTQHPNHTQGYVDAARMFEQESGTPPGVELGSITDRVQIRQAVQGGHVEEAIDKVNDLNPEVCEAGCCVCANWLAAAAAACCCWGSAHSAETRRQDRKSVV